MDVRFCDEFDGGFGWIAAEPARVQRASHALAGPDGVWLVDPVDGHGVAERVEALGRPAGVVQLLDRHGRDCARLAERWGVPLFVTPADGPPGSPFESIRVVRAPGWREVALWWAERRTLVVADALGTAPYFLAPGERLAVHPFLRLMPPRALASLSPDHVLVGHGEGLHGTVATAALQRAIATARRRTPSWLVGLVRPRPGGRATQ